MHVLTSSLHKCFLCLAEQLVVVEKAYRQQLVDLKGITNQATRNAIQVCFSVILDYMMMI